MSATRKKVLRGVVWSLLDTFANFALKFFFALAITRILAPRDYGLIAYMGLFMGIASWLAEGGFGTALIQKSDANDQDFSTGYFFNVGVSFIFFIFYFLAAPTVAEYFGEPELKNIMRLTSFNLIINSLSYIHLIKLIKEIQFRNQAILNLITSGISGILALTLALMNYGYWALVIQTLVGGLLNTIGLWIIVKWRPVLTFSWTSFREQFRFGSKIFLQGLIESIFREIHALVIGKNYKTTSLGNYSRGQKFFDLFIVQTGTAINKVLYPALVKNSQREIDSTGIYLKIYNLLFFIIAPVSLFLIFLSEPLTLVLLTDKWLEAVPFMQLYFIGGFIYILIYFNSTTILSANKPKLYLFMDVIHKVLLFIALVLTYSISIKAIIVGWLIVYYLYFLLYEGTMFRMNYRGKGKYLHMLQVVVCLVPSAFLYALTIFIFKNPSFVLTLNIILQPIMYLAVMRLSGFSVYREFSDFIKPLLPPKLQFIL